MAAPSSPSEFSRAVDIDLTPLLRTLLGGGTLTAGETAAAFEAMMTGAVHHGEMGAMLALLAARTPTPEEILGAARVMRQHVDRVETSIDPETIVDTAGTGGAPKTFNVSTAAALITAACGATVAKHGNRSRTGRGSAEVLAELGVNIDADRDVQRRCLEEAGVCFCFAIHHHPATRHVMPVRMALGFPTIFNLLGPLTSPAGAKRQVMGVYEKRFMAPIAETLRALGAVRAMVVHSEDGLDEVSISAPTHVIELEGGELREDVIDPRTLGFELAPFEAVAATDLQHAATVLRDVLSGAATGPMRDLTLLNSAAAVLVAGRAGDWPAALAMAADAIDSGGATERLERLVAVSNEDGV